MVRSPTSADHRPDVVNEGAPGALPRLGVGRWGPLASGGFVARQARMGGLHCRQAAGPVAM